MTTIEALLFDLNRDLESGRLTHAKTIQKRVQRALTLSQYYDACIMADGRSVEDHISEGKI